MVPNGWKSVRLNKLSEFVTSGSRDWAQYYSDKGSKFIRMTNLPRDGIYLKLEDLKFVDVKSDSADGKRTSLQYGDILISITAELGKIGWVPDNLGEAYINQHTALVRPKVSKCDSKYIAYLLSSHTMNHRINRLNDSGAKAGLNLPTIRSIPLTIPPLPEQRKIAKILSTWDKAITTTERLIASSQQQKKSLMQQLLTGKKRLLNPETGKVFEGDWEEVRLSQLVKVTGGNAFKSEQFATQGIPLIKISNIKADYSVNVDSSVFIVEESKYEKFKVKTGDVLIAMSGATTGKVGCYRFNDFSYLNQRVGRFDPKKNKIIKPYLFQLLKLPKVQHDILIDAVGGAQPNISNKDIERLKVKVPAIGEQQKIASVLTGADKEIELLEAKLAHLKEEKKALMQQLLTGKRRVKVETTEEATC
ncbi:TPA: restriction endonuclease subunit S [Vibrio vulnificus]|nr:restriction endonuclease subunit S [Vibrio vulnificus]